jgi:DNA-binding IclR family transcriptional regulator
VGYVVLARIEIINAADIGCPVAHVNERSEGNPSYAKELLEGLEDEQILRRSEDVWLLGNRDQTRVPMHLWTHLF